MSSTLETVSLSINVILIAISFGLTVAAWKDRQRRNSQVKIWMEQANGISQALERVIRDKWSNLYSSVSDMTNAVNAVHASAFSLRQSLYEERVLTEKDYKERQKKIWAKIDREMEEGSSDQQQEVLEDPAKQKIIEAG